MSTCQHCGKEFKQKNKYRESKTCSTECRYAVSSRSNRQTQGAQYLDRECPQCGKTFDGKTTHCSRECSNKARSGDQHPSKRNLVYPQCTICGESTQHTQRTTCPKHRRGWQQREIPTCPCGKPAENLRSKYCSAGCRSRWGRKPPVRMITKTCLGCGEEFTRPWHFPGKLKYCSNRCAHKEQKKTTEVGALVNADHTIIFRSGWEIRFWAVCLRLDIPVRSYDGPDIQTSLGVYRPDFIVETVVGERVVEVKGYLREESAQKIAEAVEQGVPVWVVDEDILKVLEMGDLSPVLV